jgi:hypothetical protein
MLQAVQQAFSGSGLGGKPPRPWKASSSGFGGTTRSGPNRLLRSGFVITLRPCNGPLARLWWYWYTGFFWLRPRNGFLHHQVAAPCAQVCNGLCSGLGGCTLKPYCASPSGFVYHTQLTHVVSPPGFTGFLPLPGLEAPHAQVV